MKDRVGIKTGSKKDFIKQGEMGKIPSHNRLAKHKKKQKSAYQQYLAENSLKDTSSGQQKVRERLKKAEENLQKADIKQRKEDKPTKDFNQLTGDELLQLFN